MPFLSLLLQQGGSSQLCTARGTCFDGSTGLAYTRHAHGMGGSRWWKSRTSPTVLSCYPFCCFLCRLLQTVASVLQLQAITAAQQRDEPLPIIAALHEPSSGIEDVLWHTTLSYHADLKAEAASRAASFLQKLRNNAKKDVTTSELAAVSAAAAAAVTPPVSLHLLRPDELKAGMITQTAVAPQLANVFSELFTQVRFGHPVQTYGPCLQPTWA